MINQFTKRIVTYCAFFLFGLPITVNAQDSVVINPVKIIFDCDFGDDGDDLAALLMLHHMQDNNECEIIAIGQCNNTPGAPASIDIINTYYGRPDIPLGQQQSETHKGDQYITFLRVNYPELTDLDGSYSPDVIDLYRKTLAAAPDSSVKFIVVGLKKDMADLFKSTPDEHSSLSGRDLVAQKVTGIYDMGGIYPSGKEFNFELEGESTKYYVENSPVPIYFHGSCWGGMHVGEELRLMDTPPGRAMDHKLAGNGGIYWDGKPVEDYQHAFDCTPVFAAVRGENTYFNLVAGCNNISPDGSNSFDTEGSCNHAYADCNNTKVSFEDLADEIEAMITADPLSLNDGRHQLFVSIDGSGIVSPSSGRYPKDTVLSLVAVADAGYDFSGWGGNLTGNINPGIVTMDSNKSIIATFTQAKYNFNAITVGGGSVFPANGQYAGILNIIATPDEGYEFEAWTGDIVSSNPWEMIMMDSAIDVTASFLSTTSVYELDNKKPHLNASPNPFTCAIRIQYMVDAPSFVELSIYNEKGQELITLVNRNQENGVYNVVWNGVDASGARVNNGIYFYRLQVGKEKFAKTIVLNRN